uniref:Uncharacterized protein n=1 Tax=Hyaloperonospora arabidopsidis (strain Emoy2) TaxID=559515 RepID=M4BNG5_HYAAE
MASANAANAAAGSAAARTRGTPEKAPKGIDDTTTTFFLSLLSEDGQDLTTLELLPSTFDAVRNVGRLRTNFGPKSTNGRLRASSRGGWVRS